MRCLWRCLWRCGTARVTVAYVFAES
eukprot:COSAG01_NODE_57948_length_309_cov_0.728571_2_plen_25_part_01